MEEKTWTAAHPEQVSSATKCSEVSLLVLRRRLGIGRVLGPLLERPGEHGQQIFERTVVVVLDRRLQRCFHAMVARDVDWIYRLHGGPPSRFVLLLDGEA